MYYNNEKNNNKDSQKIFLDIRELKCVHRYRDKPVRVVPPFSYQANQCNTKVYPPPSINPYERRYAKTTLFRYFFERGDIPLRMTYTGKRNEKAKKGELRWLVDEPEKLDYCYYMPLLIDGLAESNVGLRKLAKRGALDLIKRCPAKILATLPQLILPFKRAFNTRDLAIIKATLKVLQKMVLLGPCVGQALVPYYRQLLPVCNLYKNFNVNILGHIDYKERIGDSIERTLRVLEACGGPDAYINIKYVVPTYESHVLN